MEARELRVGNYVLYKNIQIIIDEFPEIIILLNQLKPIPLTEEWLVKFGFTMKRSDKLPNHSNWFCIDYNDVNYCFSYADFREDWGMYVEYTDSPFEEDEGKFYPVSFGIKYVYQFQNLYFALTGEELTYENLK